MFAKLTQILCLLCDLQELSTEKLTKTFLHRSCGQRRSATKVTVGWAH